MSDSKKEDSVITSCKQLVAGGAGGICLILVGHPMDTIKVRMQTMRTPKPGQPPPPFTGTFDCVAKTFRNEGLRGFYRGMLAPLIGATPINAVIFFGYGLGVRLQTGGGSPTAVENLTYNQILNAGMLSGAMAALLNAPIERIKCLLQVQQSTTANTAGTTHYKGFWDCARQVFADGGIRSAYRGMCSTWARDVPASGAYFLGYEWLKKNTPNALAGNEAARTLFAGGFAGIFFWMVAIPADVIKSRIQTAPNGKYPRGMRDVVPSMLAKEGLRAFYKGTTPVFIRAFPANAACFFGYEATMSLLNVLLPPG